MRHGDEDRYRGPLRFFGHRVMGRFRTDRCLWYESPEEVEAGLEWGKEKAKLLKWVRGQINRRLTECERRCVELYFFRGLSFRQASEELKVSPSSVHRGVRRALRKLRQAVEVERAWGERQGEDRKDVERDG